MAIFPMFWFYPNMNIQRRNNKINFTSTPLHAVNMEKINQKLQTGVDKVIISRLNPVDDVDRAAIAKIKNKWEDKKDVLKDFCNNFENIHCRNEEFFALEHVNDKPLAERLIGVANSHAIDDEYHLSYLFVNPKLQKQNFGKILLTFVLNQVKKKNLEGFTVYSTNNPFYLKVFRQAKIIFNKGESTYEKMSPQCGTDFWVKGDDCKKCLDQMKKKYGIEFSENTI